LAGRGPDVEQRAAPVDPPVEPDLLAALLRHRSGDARLCVLPVAEAYLGQLVGLGRADRAWALLLCSGGWALGEPGQTRDREYAREQPGRDPSAPRLFRFLRCVRCSVHPWGTPVRP
jgi:hypothetical protein